MRSNRRQLLRSAGLAAATLGLAGCTSQNQTGTNTSAGTTTSKETGTETKAGETSVSVSATAAVTAEWNAMRCRLDDAYTLGLAGDTAAGSTVASQTFERFEGATQEYGAHETLESTSEANYGGFEDGIVTLRDALANGNTDEAADGWRQANQHLREAQIAVVGEAGANALEAYRIGSAVNNVEVLAASGNWGGAATVAETIPQWFEHSPAHDALHDGSLQAYGTLEGTFDDLRGATSDAALADVRTASSDALEAVATGATGIAASDRLAGIGHLSAYQAYGWDAKALSSLGDHGDAAATIVSDGFANFERGAAVHEVLEESDQTAYEAFEGKLKAYVSALQRGSGVDSAATAFADATIRAEFAVVGAVDKAPVGESNDSGRDESEAELEGGPNVVDSVPDDADHVIDIETVSFEPEELTVAVGDTVAWKHEGDEAHTVTAREDDLPSGADYWASGGFDSEAAAKTGWENGTGAIQSGEVFVHTFETAGEQPYYCIPHELAGMDGTVVVKEE